MAIHANVRSLIKSSRCAGGLDEWSFWLAKRRPDAIHRKQCRGIESLRIDAGAQLDRRLSEVRGQELALLSSTFAGHVGYRLKALIRNAAICPRVTELVGQYIGGVSEHPCVMFNTAIRSIKL